MAEEGSAARLVRNTLANGAGSFVAVGTSLLLTPFLIDGLGIAAYGVFTLALTLTFFGGYAALADLGVEGAMVRYVAEARSDGDLAAVNRTVSTGAAFFTVTALLLTGPLVGFAHLLAGVFKIDPALQDEAVTTFVLISCQLVFDLPSRAFFAVLEGAQRFTVWQAIEVGRALVQAALFIVILAFGLGISELAGAMLVTSACVLVLAVIFARRAMPELRLSPSLCSRQVLRRLLKFGGGLLALRVVGTLYRQMDKLIIGTVLGVRFVTPYDVASKIHLGAALVQSVASSALLPATAFARRRADILRDMYLRGTAYTVAVTMPVVIAGFILASPLIRSWVGEAIAEDASGALRWFFVYLAFVVPHVVGSSVLVGLGKLRGVLSISIAVLAINLVVSLALVRSVGIAGVVIGTAAANAVAFPALLVLFLREFDLGLREWAQRIVVPNIPGAVVQLATAAPLLWIAARLDHVAGVGMLLLLSVAASLAAFFLFGIPRPERDVLMATLRSAVGLRPSTDGR